MRFKTELVRKSSAYKSFPIPADAMQHYIPGKNPDDEIRYRYFQYDNFLKTWIDHGQLQQRKCARAECSHRVSIGLPFCPRHLEERGLEIRDSDITGAGFGLFATQTFPVGAIVCPYFGHIGTRSHSMHKYGIETASAYVEESALPNSQTIYIDSALMRSVGSLLNGSINPRLTNVICVPANYFSKSPEVWESIMENFRAFWALDSLGAAGDHVLAVIASETITEGTELLLDYGNNYWTSVSPHITCGCADPLALELLPSLPTPISECDEDIYFSTFGRTNPAIREELNKERRTLGLADLVISSSSSTPSSSSPSTSLPGGRTRSCKRLRRRRRHQRRKSRKFRNSRK